ncbi:OLC1v1025253C1 [Oldenlandia corymbosa var. corymbosa]|uniref:OLC1v1025253C1 n=1 Tax=Oldenlandia corymbosa var. corymbosa TaxID=529605 RepID=A0AAV1C4F7_OLDCO|nr:OLC1v1025253C1 [Oldenlandia corymbosa var. corymbosa]
MATLQELAFEAGHKNQKKVKFRAKRPQDESIVLPIYVCHGRSRSFDGPKHKSHDSNSKAYSQQSGSVVSSSARRGASDSGKSINQSVDDGFFRRDEPAIDEVAIRAVVSILNGYVGQYLRDRRFRENTRAKCLECLTNEDSDDALLEKMVLGIENFERMVEEFYENGREMNLESLKYCTRLFKTISADKNGSVSSTEFAQRSNVAACAHLYLSIVYKIRRSDRISARHLLQVFCDSPFIARTHLLPDVWEHLFLPHLLHVKIWYTEETESLSGSSAPHYLNEVKMKALGKAYNDQMDIGTQKFAVYYKEWLKDGAKAPPVPSVPLPSTLNHTPSRRRYSDSFASHASNKSSLYRAIFGPVTEKKSKEVNDRHGDLDYRLPLEEHKKFSTKEPNIDLEVSSLRSERSSSRQKAQGELWLDDKRSDYFRLLSCRNDTSVNVVGKKSTLTIGSIAKERSTEFLVPNELNRAIRTVCTSESLRDCERSIRLITKAWLDSNGDLTMKSALSNQQAIEAIMEVLSVSYDDEILELAISILAQVVTIKELNANIMLNFDPQLDIFLRLLRNNSLFLKAAVLLYLAKPKAKQMIAMEWIPLVLRVLEFGDQVQTLLNIKCSPQEAAYYFLDQLLHCFDEDKNMENAGYIVSLGGLNLLLRRMEIGDIYEKNKAAAIIYSCIRADGTCRHYLAEKVNTECLLALLAKRDKKTQQGPGFALLTELSCLNRHDQRIAFLSELIKGWGRMNTMHILLVYLQRAQPEERPLVAALLLRLDLLGDPNLLGLECSVYREEAIEAIVKALDCHQVVNEKVQAQCAKALLILGGHFTYTGEPAAEEWLLKQAGFDENSLDSFNTNRVALNHHQNLIREEEAAKTWQRIQAMAMLKTGGSDLLAALSDSIVGSIPCLARASLVTVCWIITSLQSFVEKSSQSLWCSILVPRLLECLNHRDKTTEEMVLACFSLLHLLDCSDGHIELSTMINGELIRELDKLSRVTWTAKELISVITTKLMH